MSSSQTVSVSMAMLSRPRIGAYSSVHITFVKTTRRGRINVRLDDEKKKYISVTLIIMFDKKKNRAEWDNRNLDAREVAIVIRLFFFFLQFVPRTEVCIKRYLT